MTVPLEFREVTVGTTQTSISLVIPAHAAVSVTGEEASGVNELARVALGLVEPAAGTALVFGEEIARMPRRAALAYRRRVGYLPAGDGLLQNLSLYDNVALPLRFGSSMSEREIRGRMEIILAAVRLSGVSRWRPAAAGRESRRRAALARALAFDPELVILEHPFDGLSFRTSLELIALARGGETDEGPRRSVLVTSQSIPDVIRMHLERRYRVTRGKLETDETGKGIGNQEA